MSTIVRKETMDLRFKKWLLTPVLIALLTVACNLRDNTLRGSLDAGSSAPQSLLQYNLQPLTESVPLLETRNLSLSLSNSGETTFNNFSLTTNSNFISELSNDCTTMATGDTCTYNLQYQSPGAAGLTTTMTVTYKEGGAEKTLDVPLSLNGAFPGQGTLEKMFPTNGANWNDYVARADFTQPVADETDTACTVSAIGYNACVHGGEHLKVNIGTPTCDNLSISDALDAFNWYCDDRSGKAIAYSSSLKQGKSLKDLLKTGPLDWENNSVTVTDTTGPTTVLTTPLENTWWSNTVNALPDNSATTAVDLDNGGELAGRIYVLESSRATKGYRLIESKISIVTMPGVWMSASATGANYVIATHDSDFLWIEGQYNNRGSNNLVVMLLGDATTTVAFTRFNRFTNIKAIGEGDDHFLSTNAANQNYEMGSNNIFRDIDIANFMFGFYQTNYAIWGRSLLERITFRNLVSSGYNVWSFQGGMVFKEVNCFNVGNSCLTHRDGGSTTIVGITGTSSGNVYNSYLDYNITLLNLMSANTSTGYYYDRTPNSTHSHIAAVNGINGILYSPGSGANNSKYSGVLMVGGNSTSDCSLIGGSENGAGLNNTTCSATGTDGETTYTGHTSTAIFRPGRTSAGSFLDKVTTDDTTNTSDTNGLASYGSISLLDWFNFENPFRSYGLEAASFPLAGGRGDCPSGSCRIWDWSLSNAGTVLFNRTYDGFNPNSIFVNGATCPQEVDGNLTETDQYLDPSSNPAPRTYLLNAWEVIADDIGNDNGLCESNETCIYTPNFGAYQGHGDWKSNTCNFVDGTVSGVTMHFYPSNGF